MIIPAFMAAMGMRGREQIVGIDLGTTFSVVAVKKNARHAVDDRVMVIPDRDTGKLLVPSVVSFLPHCRWCHPLVGAEAQALRSTEPNRTIFNAKRFIGRHMSEVETEVGMHPYQVAPNSTEPGAIAGFRISTNRNATYWVSPEEVGSAIVKHLMRSVKAHMGFSMSRAVICVPAKFSPKETKATAQAFEKAGIKVMRILEEPTAAAVAYGLDKAEGIRNVIVYDIGGGTLDTSLLYMSGKSISVLGIAGDDRFGGSDFDARMRVLLESKISTAQEMHGSPEEPLCDANNLHILAEKAKITLSSETSTEVRCTDSAGKVRSIQVTRKEFEHASEDLFSRAVKPVEQVLADQMMDPDHVDAVVLVGGASRTPRIRELLREYFGPDKRIHTEIDPDITVAYGAANIVD